MSALLEGVVGAVGTACNLALGLLSISFQCGSVIVSTIFAIYGLVASLISGTIEVLYILYQDFCVFSYDLLSKVFGFFNLFVSLISGLVSTLKNAALYTKDTVLHVFDFITGGFSSGFDAVSQGWDKILDLAELLKWCLVVAGQGFWIAIQLIPLCVCYLIYSVLSLAGMVITETLDKIQTALNYSSKQMGMAYDWGFIFVTDFPVEAILGLVTGLALLFCMHRNRSSIRSATFRTLRKTGTMVRTSMGKTWCFMARCVRFGQHRRLQVGYESDEDDVPLALRLSRKSLSPNSLKTQLLQEKEDKLCVVCLAKNKCVILMPCRHLCMCSDCSSVIINTTSSCPICRTDFERAVTVFM